MTAYVIDIKDRQSTASRELGTIRYPVREEPRSVWVEPRQGLAPQWLVDIQPRMEELLNLPPDWDGQGAPPVDRHDLAAALAFLRVAMHDEMIAPWIGPLSNGGVQLAWTRGDLEVEAVFDHARNDWQLFVTDGENDQDVSIWDGEAVWLLGTVADRLTRSDPVLA